MVSFEGIAWFLMADGSIGMRTWKEKGSWNLSPYVAFNNTEKKLTLFIKHFLNQQGIKGRMRFRDRQGRRKPRYDLLIYCIPRVRKLLGKALPYLIGRKRKQALLMLEFCRRFHRARGGGRRVGQMKNVEEQKRFLEMVKYADKISELNCHGGARRHYTFKYFAQIFKKK